jgi:hypothetical protein
MRPLDQDEIDRFQRIAKNYGLTVKQCWELREEWNDAIDKKVQRDMAIESARGPKRRRVKK